MMELLTRENLAKLRFVRDTIVLVLGAFLTQVLLFNIRWDFIFPVVLAVTAIVAVALRRFKRRMFDTFETLTLLSFAWSMDQIAQLFIATGLAIYIITDFNLAGLFIFGVLLAVGLIMEFAVRQIKDSAKLAGKIIPEHPANPSTGRRIEKRVRDALSSLVPAPLRPQLAFYAGLILGGAVSLIVYILIFSAFLFGVLQALVAAGTLTLAGVTSFLTIRDRRESLAREMADRVYVPMRVSTESWQNPEPLFPSSNWNNLKANVPYLTLRVASELQKEFDRAEQILKEMGLLSTPIDEALQKPTAKDSGRITISKGNATYADFNLRLLLFQLLKTGQSLREFAGEYISKNRPTIKEWELGYYVMGSGTKGGSGIGNSKEAEDHVATTLQQLEANAEAVQFRTLFKELTEIGRKSHESIEKELRKPIAPISSAPPKNP